MNGYKNFIFAKNKNSIKRKILLPNGYSLQISLLKTRPSKLQIKKLK